MSKQHIKRLGEGLYFVWWTGEDEQRAAPKASREPYWPRSSYYAPRFDGDDRCCPLAHLTPVGVWLLGLAYKITIIPESHTTNIHLRSWAELPAWMWAIEKARRRVCKFFAPRPAPYALPPGRDPSRPAQHFHPTA